MIFEIYNWAGKDKKVQHQIFGELSCQDLKKNYQQCLNITESGRNTDKQCKSLHNLGNYKKLIFIPN